MSPGCRTLALGEEAGFSPPTCAIPTRIIGEGGSMELTLLLNATYEPLRVVNWQKAITLLWQGKVEVLEVYDREIHGGSISIKLPAVMRLLKMVKLREAHRSVKFSRINIFTRDRFRCQYCRRKFHTEDLTFDHVIPIAKGGNKTWENIVTACWGCNNRKSGRLPEEAGMHPMRQAPKPEGKPGGTRTDGGPNTAASRRGHPLRKRGGVW